MLKLTLKTLVFLSVCFLVVGCSSTTCIPPPPIEPAPKQIPAELDQDPPNITPIKELPSVPLTDDIALEIIGLNYTAYYELVEKYQSLRKVAKGESVKKQ